MKLTPHNLIHHELIGLEVEVAESTNKYLEGIKGKVVDETKNMLIIEDKKERRIPKSCSCFIFDIGKKVKVDGRLLLYRPEDRIQTRFKKKFRRMRL